MDIRLKLTEDSQFCDFSFLNNDLEASEDLESSVLISLLSDRRISDEDLADNQTDKKGWWGDSIDPNAPDLTGSKLWLLLREKQTPETLERAKEYCEEALQWLLDDGVAASISVATSYPETERLLIEIKIERPGKSATSYAYNLIWEGKVNGL